MSKLPYLDSKGVTKEEIDFKVTQDKVSERAVYESMKNHFAMERLGTAFIKNRALVNLTGKKPWRQKGTGRARASSLKLPHMRGGGAAFGNQRRNFKYDIPKKIKRLAIRSIILSKIGDGVVKVIDTPVIKDGKTKEMVKSIEKIVSQENVLLITNNDDDKLKRSSRNIAWLDYLNVNRLVIDKLFYSKNILVLKDAVDDLQKILNR